MQATKDVRVKLLLSFHVQHQLHNKRFSQPKLKQEIHRKEIDNNNCTSKYSKIKSLKMNFTCILLIQKVLVPYTKKL